VRGSWLSDEAFACISPKLQAAKYDLQVDILTEYSKSIGIYSYHPNIQLHSLSPALGVTYGGTKVTVRGSGFIFSADLFCKFGELEITPATFVSPSMIFCSTPAYYGILNITSSIRLQVSTNGNDFSSDSLLYQYHVPIIIHDFSPKIGPSNGGTPLVIQGAKFIFENMEILCMLGDKTSTATVLSKTTITCRTPKGNVGKVQLSLSMNGGADWVNVSGGFFSYFPSPSIKKFDPLTGSFTGGTMVKVFGSNFDQSTSILCKFGDYDALRTIWISGNQMICETPSHFPESVPIIISINRMNMIESNDKFTFIGIPKVYEITPKFGSHGGGTPILVKGHNFIFTKLNYCKFGDQIVDADLIGTTTIRCKTPKVISKEELSVPFRVSNNGVDFSQDFINFLYMASPILDEITPSFGTLLGSSIINIYGKNLNGYGKAWCRFGPNTVVEATISNDTAIQCKTVEWDVPEMVPLQISTNLIDWSDKLMHFHYKVVPEISLIYPLSGQFKEKTTISIIGSLFSDTDVYYCFFGDSIVSSVRQSDTRLECKTPILPSPGSVPIFIGINHHQNYATGFSFRFVQQYSINKIWPSNGSTSGGTVVSVHGSSFIESYLNACKFGENVVPGLFISSNLIQCISPPYRPGNFDFKVSSNGRDFIGNRFNITFTFVPDIELERLEPKNGPISGTTIHIYGRNFSQHPRLKCILDDEAVETTIINNEKIQCLLPPQERSRSVIIAVKIADHFLASGQFIFYFISEALLLSVNPRFLPERQGIPLQVLGANFFNSSSLFCSFGDKYGHTVARPVSSTVLFCDSPSIPMVPPETEIKLSLSL